MEKEFVPYELALELKQLGFDEPCLASIDQTDFIHIKGTEYPIRGAMIYYAIDCPTYSQAFRWFREKYDLYADIYRIGKKFNAGIEDMNIGSSKEMVVEGVDYEEAELECLKKLIKIVKEKQCLENL
jgi:hypothetical protein